VVREFHPPQFGEKFLKARLVEADIHVARRHDREKRAEAARRSAPLRSLVRQAKLGCSSRMKGACHVN
jgi:hypothetical protein